MSLDPEVAYWAEMSEALASGDVVQAAAELPGDPLGAVVGHPGDAVAFTFTKLDIWFFNRVLGFGVARPAVAEDVDDVVAFYDGAERSVSAAQIAPHAAPPELIGWFEERGFSRSRTWVKMWHDLSSMPEASTDLRIERIGPDRAADFGRLGVVEAYEFPEVVGPAMGATVGRPGWIHYMGFDGDTPVSTAAMRIHDGVAWFGFGATSESHRGRGGQSALFAQRLRDARDAGCRFAIVETGKETPEDPNPSYRNMVRSGFQLAYDRHNWVRRVPVQPEA
jgi:GNAT superfamily N-acetyltransferase